MGEKKEASFIWRLSRGQFLAGSFLRWFYFFKGEHECILSWGWEARETTLPWFCFCKHDGRLFAAISEVVKTVYGQTMSVYWNHMITEIGSLSAFRLNLSAFFSGSRAHSGRGRKYSFFFPPFVIPGHVLLPLFPIAPSDPSCLREACDRLCTKQFLMHRFST